MLYVFYSILTITDFYSLFSAQSNEKEVLKKNDDSSYIEKEDRQQEVYSNNKNIDLSDGICRIPELQYENLHENKQKEKQCRIRENWGYFETEENNKWHLYDNIKSMGSYKIECEYRSIIRIDDFKNNISEYRTLNEGQQVLGSEVVEVQCQARNLFNNKTGSKSFDSLFPLIVNKLHKRVLPTLSIKEENKNDKCEPLNIILMSYDSVSRVSWIKRLKKSYYYALETMNFDILEGYGVVGDGTPVILVLNLLKLL